MNTNYYVYIHVLEDDTVFYVGLGQNDRALDVKGRTETWKEYYNPKCKYAIVKDNLTLEEGCILEQKLIKQYGRLCDNTGTLTNIQLGGHCPNLDYYLSTAIFSLDFYGNIIKAYSNIKEAQDIDKFSMSSIRYCLKGNLTSHKKHQFIKQVDYLEPSKHIHISIVKKNEKEKIPIVAIKKTKWSAIVIKEYDDILELKDTEYSIEAVKLCLKESHRTHKKLHWFNKTNLVEE